VTGNREAEFVDADETVLINKQGIVGLRQRHLKEEELLARAYEILLEEVRLDTPITNRLIRYAHECIFGELFTWAGNGRTVNISKPEVTWPPFGFIDELMESFEREVLRKHPAAGLSDDETFCRGVAEIQGEFLVIHPFREGNARAIKLVTDLMAAQTGRPLLRYDQTDAGRDEYFAAASQAFGRNYAPLVAILRRALTTGRQGPSTGL
jgi:cell filamentation protein